MQISDTQAALLNIQLSAIGQMDLSDNDDEMLQTLQYLLEMALDNVRRARGTEE